MRLIHVRIGATRLRETVVDRSLHITSRKSVELLLGNTTFFVVANNFQLMHVVLLTRLELVPKNPGGRLPDVLMHGGRDGANHPAVAIAVAHLRTNPLGLRAVPKLVPAMLVEVAHDLLVFGTVAGHNIAIRINEERVERHVAWEQALLSVDVVDKSMVEVCTEPLLGALGLEELVHKVLEVLGNHWAIVDDVVRLDKIEAVVEGRSRKLHSKLVGQLVERDEVLGILVLNSHAETNVRMLHLNELLERLVSALEPVRKPANLVVGLLKTLDGDANSHLGELLTEVEDSIGEIPVGGDDDAVALLVELAYDVLEVSTNERLAARDVGEVHARELLDRLERELLLRTRRRLEATAHITTRVATISNDYSAVELLVCHIASYSFISLSSDRG